VLLRCPLLAAAGLALVGAGPAPPGAFHVEHTPPACFVADKSPRLVACLVPRSSRANLRVLFRADDGNAWYATALRYDVPCYWGVLPRPSRTSRRIIYAIEAQGVGITARTTEHAVAVAADASACAGRPAPVEEKVRASWEAPAGAPRTPPGFEGTRSAGSSTGAAAPVAPPLTAPATKPPGPRPAPAAATPRPATGGGHGRRNALIAVVAAGAAAAGGTAVLANRNEGSGAPATTLGTGLPATGVAGVYIGTETVNYPGGCVGVDDVVLNLQESGSLLSGVLTFTVRTCPCCATGRGSNPVSGARSGTSLQLATPIGYSYAGSFAGNRLSGSVAGPGGVTGSWTVEKR